MENKTNKRANEIIDAYKEFADMLKDCGLGFMEITTEDEIQNTKK